MASSSEYAAPEEVPKTTQRKRLQLKPRDPQAAAKKEEERLRGTHSGSLFGDAKPREVVIADRVGKTEEDVLKEEVRKEKLHLRLTPEQNQERLSHEAAVKEVEKQIEGEVDDKKKGLLQVELDARQKKLDELMEQFVNVTLEHAKSGEAPRMSQLRKMQQEQVPVPAIYPASPPHVVHQPSYYSTRYNPTQQYHQNNQAKAGYHQHVGRGGHNSRGYYNNNNNNNNNNNAIATAMSTNSTMVNNDSSSVSTRGRRGGMQRGRGYHGNASLEEYAATPDMANVGGNLYDVQARQYIPRGGRQGRQHIPGGMQRPLMRDPGSIITGDTFYQGPFPGQGVGGEIEFDSFGGQDRY